MAYKGKTVLVTGSTGLIGYNLVCRLVKEGCNKIYVTGRNLEKLKSTFDGIKDNSIVLITHDASQHIPKEVKDVDFIFHAAGPMEREVVVNRPVDVVAPNIIGAINCLEYLKAQKNLTGKRGRMVVFSSVTVYDNPTNEDYVATEDITRYACNLDASTACYAESKRMVEVIARAYVKQYGLDAVIARFSTVYGYTKNVPNTAFYEFVNNAIAGKDITLNSNAAPRRDNIYVDDAIDGLLLLADKGTTGEAYNVSSGGEKGNYAAVDEIARMAVIVAGKGTHVYYKDSCMNRKSGLMLDNRKLKALGWDIQCSLEEGMKRTIASYQ